MSRLPEDVRVPQRPAPPAPGVVREGPEVLDLTTADRPADLPTGRHALVVGTEDWSIASAIEQLHRGGWQAHRCQDSLERTLPCRALDPAAGCPLDRNHVSVAVAVRGRPATGVRPGEMGAICAVRASVPVVLAGYVEGSDLAPFGTAVAEGADVVGACEHAVSAARR